MIYISSPYFTKLRWLQTRNFTLIVGPLSDLHQGAETPTTFIRFPYILSIYIVNSYKEELSWMVRGEGRGRGRELRRKRFRWCEVWLWFCNYLTLHSRNLDPPRSDPKTLLSEDFSIRRESCYGFTTKT